MFAIILVMVTVLFHLSSSPLSFCRERQVLADKLSSSFLNTGKNSVRLLSICLQPLPSVATSSIQNSSCIINDGPIYFFCSLLSSSVVDFSVEMFGFFGSISEFQWEFQNRRIIFVIPKFRKVRILDF